MYDNLKSVENVITLDKLIGLLFLFCLPLLSILLLRTKRNDLAHPVMGTIFLVILQALLALYQLLLHKKVYFKANAQTYPISLFSLFCFIVQSSRAIDKMMF